MREIKFRMWLDGRFHYWGFIASKYGDDYSFSGLADTNAEPLSMKQKMERSQQYTGLHDKNGKEIYEGDIGRFQHGNEKQLIACEICWGSAALWWPNKYLFGDRFEIIGNIYENPELLEVKK